MVNEKQIILIAFPRLNETVVNVLVVALAGKLTIQIERRKKSFENIKVKNFTFNRRIIGSFACCYWSSDTRTIAHTYNHLIYFHLIDHLMLNWNKFDRFSIISFSLARSFLSKCYSFPINKFFSPFLNDNNWYRLFFLWSLFKIQFNIIWMLSFFCFLSFDIHGNIFLVGY